MPPAAPMAENTMPTKTPQPRIAISVTMAMAVPLSPAMHSRFLMYQGRGNKGRKCRTPSGLAVAARR